MFSNSFKRRSLIVNIGIALLFPLLIYQMYSLSIRKQEFLGKFAEQQHNLVVPIPPERGLIYDRNMQPFATNLRVPSIYAVPRLITDKERPALVKKVSDLLDLKSDFLEDRLGRDKAFIWVKRHATSQEADEVAKLNHPALGIRYERKRFYSYGRLLSHVLGFCNIDNEGVEGIELLYNRELSGRMGYRYTKRDAHGREIIALERKLVPAVDGANLILTIDQRIQFFTEYALEAAFLKWKAKSAIAIVMNPKTGEILAMATRPAFDPNDLKASEIAERRNRPITDIFEPGSIFKIITVSAALEEKAVDVTDRFNCEQGQWLARKGRIIHDVHPYGELSVPEVLIKSSNIGTVKIAKELGEKKLYDYIKTFGFGEKTGIDFPGEVSGIFRPLNQWSKLSITSIPYGQEVAATAIQMVRALAIIANGGHKIKPYLLKEVRDAQGITLFKREPIVSDPILSDVVVQNMKEILQRVVQEGTGKNASIEGVKVAGKTGTSQKLNPSGGYSHSQFVGSFVGFAPADDPELAVIVSIDEPKPLYYGGTVAAPVFKEIVERSLFYLGYVPGRDESSGADGSLPNASTSQPVLPKNPPPASEAISHQAR